MLETPTTDIELREFYTKAHRTRTAAFARIFSELHSFIRAALRQNKEAAPKRRPQINPCLT